VTVTVDYDVHLLPSNATPYEKALSASFKPINDIPVPIDLLDRPYEIPAQFLPHLAWNVSLSLWYRDWPEWKKRRAVAQSIKLHYLKGTLPGIEGWLGLIDATLQSYVIPPVGGFVSDNWTDAEKAAFLAQFAQLRIFLESNPGTAAQDLYADDGFVGESYSQEQSNHFTGGDFTTVSTASERYGRHAYVWDNGVSTQVTMLPVSWAGAEAINQDLVGVVIPGEDDGGFFFADGCLDDGCITAAYITSKLLTIANDRSYIPLSPQPVVLPADMPPLSLLDVVPERIATTGTIGVDVMHVDAGYINDFLGDKDENLRLYDRYYLYDPDRVVGGPGTDGGLFLDYTRLEIPPFYAELRVNLPGADPADVLMLDDGFLDNGLLIPVQGIMDEVAAALRVAKAHRDELWFTTQTRRAIELNDEPLFDGTVGFDDMVLIYD